MNILVTPWGRIDRASVIQLAQAYHKEGASWQQALITAYSQARDERDRDKVPAIAIRQERENV